MMNWKSRLKAVGAGAMLVVVGYLRIKSGTHVVTNWTGQPMSFGLIAAGLVVLVSAALPERLVSKLATVKKR